MTGRHPLPMHPGRRLIPQYFLYFGVMGIYLPYFNLYCDKLGFSEIQIGLISALRSVVLIIFALFWGIVADRFAARRVIYILCSLVSAAMWTLFLITQRFWPMMLAMFLYSIFYAPLIPFLEAFSMDLLGTGKQRYGRLRLWGSIAFIVMVLILGQVLDRTPIQRIVGWILIGSLLQALAALFIPTTAGRKELEMARGLRLLRHPQVVRFLTAAFLMLASHGAYYGFFTIHLARLGFGRAFIGLCWAVASAAEIVVMIYSAHLFRRFSLLGVLRFAFAAAVVRWLFLAFARSPAAFLAAQVMHAATYGAFHMASILYMDSLADPSVKTFAQAVNNAVTYGFGLMVGFFASGWLYARAGSTYLFVISGLVALAGAVVLGRGSATS